MRRVLVVTLLAALAVGSVSCGDTGSDYVGRWECSAGGGDYLEIKVNNGGFLVTDEDGMTLPGSLNDDGVFVVSGIPMMDSLPLPIDSDTGELICASCGCNRFKKVS